MAATSIDNQPALRRGYGAIVRGYHTLNFKGQRMFLRHVSVLEQADLDEEYEKWFEAARKKGLATNDERCAILTREGFLTKVEEDALAVQQGKVEQIHRDKKVAYLPSQVKELGESLKQEEQALWTLQCDRLALIGTTAETFAQQKVDEFYVVFNLFSSPDFEKRTFSDEEYDELAREDMVLLSGLYSEALSNVSADCIKRIALMPSFQEPFRLCKDDVSSFFGRPVARLSYFQIRLANYGAYFKSILVNESQIPPHLLNDPDGLMDWVTGAHNSKAVMTHKEDGKSVALMGGTQSDMKELGLDKNAKSLHAVSGGKAMTMQEMMKAQGF